MCRIFEAVTIKLDREVAAETEQRYKPIAPTYNHILLFHRFLHLLNISRCKIRPAYKNNCSTITNTSLPFSVTTLKTNCHIKIIMVTYSLTNNLWDILTSSKCINHWAIKSLTPSPRFTAWSLQSTLQSNTTHAYGPEMFSQKQFKTKQLLWTYKILQKRFTKKLDSSKNFKDYVQKDHFPLAHTRRNTKSNYKQYIKMLSHHEYASYRRPPSVVSTLRLPNKRQGIHTII